MAEAVNNAYLRYKKIWLSLGYLLILFVIYLSITPTPPSGPEIPFFDKIGHLLAYATLMGWFSQLYLGKTAWIRLGLAFVCMGVIMEIVQGLGSTRMFEFADMAANSAGVLLGWWLSRGWFAGTLLAIERRILGSGN